MCALSLCWCHPVWQHIAGAALRLLERAQQRVLASVSLGVMANLAIACLSSSHFHLLMHQLSARPSFRAGVIPPPGLPRQCSPSAFGSRRSPEEDRREICLPHLNDLERDELSRERYCSKCPQVSQRFRAAKCSPVWKPINMSPLHCVIFVFYCWHTS